MKTLVSFLIGGALLFGSLTLGTQSVSAHARQDQKNEQNRRDNDRNNNNRRRHHRRHHRRHRRHRRHHDKLSY